MPLKEELESLLRRYDKKEFTLSESERLAMHRDGEMTQEMEDSLLAKELLHHLETFNQQWQRREEMRKKGQLHPREGTAMGFPSR